MLIVDLLGLFLLKSKIKSPIDKDFLLLSIPKQTPLFLNLLFVKLRINLILCL